VLIAEGCRQVFGLAAGYNQLPTLGGESSHHGTADAARGPGDQCDFVHVGSLMITFRLVRQVLICRLND
jgi:hypothetical protein